MKWSILICTLPERSAKLRRLLKQLDSQRLEGVEYRIHDAGRSMTTGEKRNILIAQSESDYFSFIDDDDQVTPEYIPSIKKAMELNPDVITFDGWYTEYGRNERRFTIRLGSRYYDDPKGEFFYYRFPNHLAVMKREKVEHVKFPHVWQREDYLWSDKIRSMNLLKTEVHISKPLYHYDCHPRK